METCLPLYEKGIAWASGELAELGVASSKDRASKQLAADEIFGFTADEFLEKPVDMYNKPRIAKGFLEIPDVVRASASGDIAAEAAPTRVLGSPARLL